MNISDNALNNGKFAIFKKFSWSKCALEPNPSFS